MSQRGNIKGSYEPVVSRSCAAGCLLGQGLVHHLSPRQLDALGSKFRPTAPGEAREAIFLPIPRKVGVGVAMRDAQADVPSTKGLGRNLRSKTRWFTGFCNSHQVSHFATFFIDARAEISVAESRLML